MTDPYWQDDWTTLYLGDCREMLRSLPTESVHCVITSPPYWGLRDYDIEPSTWGAWRGALGLEPTPEMYVQHIVECFREVRRVLRKDGTCWVNLGDGYWGGKGQSGAPEPHEDEVRDSLQRGAYTIGRHGETRPSDGRHPILKPKDLIGMPWRVAFALQAEGWWLRSDIIWSKPNPMPESVTDRPTRSHEYVFLLTKAAKYYYDADAIREPHARLWDASNGGSMATGYDQKARLGGHERQVAYPEPNPAGRNKRSVWEIATQSFGMEMCGACILVYTSARYRRLRAGGAPRCTFEVAEDEQCGGTRFERLDTTWECLACGSEYTVKGLQRLPRAARCACGRDDAWIGHFASFPEALVQPCIQAGTSERGCCPECGAPWVRVVEASGGTIGASWHSHLDDSMRGQRIEDKRSSDGSYQRTLHGWRFSCKHETEPVPCTVLDPFAGSGTVGVVARKAGRCSILIDLKAEYLEMAKQRMAQGVLI